MRTTYCFSNQKIIHTISFYYWLLIVITYQIWPDFVRFENERKCIFKHVFSDITVTAIYTAFYWGWSVDIKWVIFLPGCTNNECKSNAGYKLCSDIYMKMEQHGENYENKNLKLWSSGKWWSSKVWMETYHGT